LTKTHEVSLLVTIYLFSVFVNLLIERILILLRITGNI